VVREHYHAMREWLSGWDGPWILNAYLASEPLTSPDKVLHIHTPATIILKLIKKSNIITAGKYYISWERRRVK
jgi:hypothetical protein